jgi:hypothetical protein
MFSPGMAYEFLLVHCLYSVRVGEIPVFSLLYGLSTALVLVKIQIFSYRVLLNFSPCFKSRHPQFCDNEILGKGYLSHESVPAAVKNFLAQRPFCGVWNMALKCGHRAPPNWAF